MNCPPSPSLRVQATGDKQETVGDHVFVEIRTLLERHQRQTRNEVSAQLDRWMERHQQLLERALDPERLQRAAEAAGANGSGVVTHSSHPRSSNQYLPASKRRASDNGNRNSAHLWHYGSGQGQGQNSPGEAKPPVEATHSALSQEKEDELPEVDHRRSSDANACDNCGHHERKHGRFSMMGVMDAVKDYGEMLMEPKGANQGLSGQVVHRRSRHVQHGSSGTRNTVSSAPIAQSVTVKSKESLAPMATMDSIDEEPDPARRVQGFACNDEARRTQAMTLHTQATGVLQIEPERSRVRKAVMKLVASYLFEIVFAMLILSNSVIVGFQVEYATRYGPDKDHAVLSILQWFYMLAFTLELLLRIFAERGEFFCSSQWTWNYLDMFIVVSSLCEVMLDLILSSISNTTSIRIVRIVRITRLVRVMRIIRIVRFVHALRTLVYSIACTMKSLVWAMLLLLMIIYVFGILFAQSTSEYIIENFSDATPVESLTENTINLKLYWVTLPRAMFTLFKSITGGVSWDVVVHPLSDISWVWVGLFGAFISFTFLAVLNVVTGVFCQSAIETAQQNEDLIIQAQIANRKVYTERIRRMFREIDADGSGFITVAEFEDNLTNGIVSAYFESMDIDTGDAWTLFKLLDNDEGNLIDIEEFVMGCLRLKGAAKSVDIAKLTCEQARLQKTFYSFMQFCEDEFSKIDKSMKRQSSRDKDKSTAAPTGKDPGKKSRSDGAENGARDRSETASVSAEPTRIVSFGTGEVHVLLEGDNGKDTAL